jgi:gas vesicle protein
MDDATRRVGRQKRTTSGSKTEPPRAADPLLTSEDEARARELRGEIAETRSGISETIDAIQERLQPANLVAHAGESVRNAATEKVKQMANTAGAAADQVLGSSFMETVKANPIPAAMIGIGAAWMLFNRRSESRIYRDGRGEPYRSYDRSGRYGYGSYDESVPRAYEGSYGAVGTRGTIGTEDTQSVASRAKDYASDVASRAQEFTGDVRDTARRTSRRAQVKFDDVLRNNPLALGAAAALVGAVVGMTVPATEAENQLMGDARDSVVERARGLANEAANRVSEAADNTQDVVSRAASQVKDVASRAAGTTRPNADRTTLPDE